MSDPRLPPIPPPVNDPACVNAVLLALKQRVEALTAAVLALQAK